MTTNTTVWAIPKPDATDFVVNGDDAMRALVDRIDYLLGEQGNFTFGAVSGTQTTTINLSRAYPNGFEIIACFRNLPAAGAGSVQAVQLTTAGGPGGVAQATLAVNRTTAASSIIGYVVKPKP